MESLFDLFMSISRLVGTIVIIRVILDYPKIKKRLKELEDQAK